MRKNAMFIQVWLISLSIMISSCVHLPVNVMILHFLYSYKNFFVCVCACMYKFSLLLNLLTILCAVTFTLQKTHAHICVLKSFQPFKGLCLTLRSLFSLNWFLCGVRDRYLVVLIHVEKQFSQHHSVEVDYSQNVHFWQFIKYCIICNYRFVVRTLFYSCYIHVWFLCVGFYILKICRK